MSLYRASLTGNSMGLLAPTAAVATFGRVFYQARGIVWVAAIALWIVLGYREHNQRQYGLTLADLFSSNPDWNKLLSLPAPKLSAEEVSFLDHEVTQLCDMVNDW